MNARSGEIVVVGGGLLYLAGLSWAMRNLSYDIWGALVVAPIYLVIGAIIVRAVFRGSLTPITKPLFWGLLIKVGGAATRYWVGFEAYGGGIDAARYHDKAVKAAGKVWSGEASFVTVLPGGTGTIFMDRFTAFTYTLTGGSQLAGFVTFSFLAFIGTIFFVKAAVIAVPSMAVTRYAWFCVLFPSIVYWPSSIGKEAVMMLGLGVGTVGIAILLTRGQWFSSLPLIILGIGLAAIIRPHIAGIWIAATLPALIVAVVHRGRTSSQSGNPRKVSRLGLALVLLVAIAAFSVIAATTIKFLAPNEDPDTGTTDALTQILEETSRRTSQAGSNFTPPSVSNPIIWPYASARTLFRPLPFEARGVAQLISAAEVTALLGLIVLSRRRLANLLRLALSNPYIMFVLTALFLAGLAYTSLANLGVLTRQKSLVIPFLVLLPCLPERVWRRPSESTSPETTIRDIVPSRANSAPPPPVNQTARTGELDIWA